MHNDNYDRDQELKRQSEGTYFGVPDRLKEPIHDKYIDEGAEGLRDEVKELKEEADYWNEANQLLHHDLKDRDREISKLRRQTNVALKENELLKEQYDDLIVEYNDSLTRLRGRLANLCRAGWTLQGLAEKRRLGHQVTKDFHKEVLYAYEILTGKGKRNDNE